jgi:hypothetical protein
MTVQNNGSGMVLKGQANIAELKVFEFIQISILFLPLSCRAPPTFLLADGYRLFELNN